MGRAPLHPNIDDLDLASVLNALSDPIRLSIVYQLSKKGSSSCMGSCPNEISKSTISHHFRILRESGLIRSEKEGVTLVSTLRKEELNKKFPGLLDLILKLYQKTH